MTEVTVSALFVYPIKSARGIEVSSALALARGFEHDRRFMLVDDGGAFISQRNEPRLALLETRIDGDVLVVTDTTAPAASAHRALRVPLVPSAISAPRRRVRIWNDDCEAVDMGPDARAFFRPFLGHPCSLVYMPDDSRRIVDQEYATSADEIVGFADGYPFLVAGEASLAELNARLTLPLPMNRFRPNIVVRGSGAFEEDDWRTVTIGATPFSVVKPCARCVMVTIDQATAEGAKEPLATLAKYRARKGGVMFGQNAVAHREGRLALGDRLRVTSTR